MKISCRVPLDGWIPDGDTWVPGPGIEVRIKPCPPTIRVLRDSRLRVWEQLRDMANRAASEERDFTDDEMAKWDWGNAQLDRWDLILSAHLKTDHPPGSWTMKLPGKVICYYE